MEILELGGGDKPQYRPNLDCRKFPSVDILADFESGLPLKSEAFDFIFSQYTIEHLSWRRVKGFIAEIYRILKPDGKAQIVTANLSEQCKKAISEEWSENTSCMIFGDQDYGENAHKCGFSPAYAERLFREAGFIYITVKPLYICATDMIIEATKSEKIDCYEREYFEDGTTGYRMYRDFPSHWRMVDVILSQKPENVLDLGGARGYIVKKLEANGVRAVCMDKSLHCWHTRATDSFVLHDALDVPYPFGDKEFDLCYSASFMEHFREEDIPKIIKEASRVCKRGYFTITFEKTPQDIDITHKTFKPIDWWYEQFKKHAPDFSVKIMSPEEAKSLEAMIIKLPTADGLVKLNVGSYMDMFYYGWINIDNLDLLQWAQMNGYKFENMDVKNGIKRQDNSADIILASHFLEHLTREEGAKFLTECLRVLKPDGIVRLAVPDAKLISRSYLKGNIMEFGYVNVGVENAPDSAEAFFHLLLAGHKTVYDENSLKKALEKAGFMNVKPQKPFESASMVIKQQTIPMYPTLSLYMEARKAKAVEAFDTSRTPADLATTHVQKMIKNVTSKTAPTRVNSKLKVALISTPLLLVPPANYGGLELIVANLGKELAKLGHDVTIFAPNGSYVEGCTMREVGEPKNTVFVDWLRAEGDMFDLIKQEVMTGGYDIIHGHNWFGMEYRAKALDSSLKVCHTHHGGLLADWWTKSRAPFKLNMIGISDWMKSVYERQGIPTRTVYNGVDLSKYPLMRKKGDRFLWMSRIAFFKAPHLAVQVAKETGIKLDVAGATMFVEDARYVEEIKKSCDGEQIRFIGEVSHEQKVKLLQNAKALLVTAKWGEPFGLHVLEALGCGTQVIAVADGGIKETLKTMGGVLCEDLDALKDAVTHFRQLAPTRCRRNAMMFSTKTMAQNYVQAYRTILSGNEW